MLTKSAPIKKLLLIIFLTILSSGCWNMVQVEDTATGSGLAVDLNPDGKILFVAQFNRPINAQQMGTNRAQTEVFIGHGQTVTQAARDITLLLPRLPLWSHADVILLGDNLARTDLSIVADFLARNRNIRIDAYMFVTHNCSPYEVFIGECPLSLCTARGIIKITRHQEQQLGMYVPVKAVDFLGRLTTPGIDPVLPQVTVLRQKGQLVPHIQGTAVFRGRKKVGSLNETESRGYRWLHPSLKRGGIVEVHKPFDLVDSISLEVIQFSTATTPRMENGHIVMDIDIKADLNFYGESGTRQVLTSAKIAHIQALCDQTIKEQVSACIDKALLLNADIMGWGQLIHHHYPQVWEQVESNWYDILPQVKFKVNVKSNVKRTNMTDTIFQFR